MFQSVFKNLKDVQLFFSLTLLSTVSEHEPTITITRHTVTVTWACVIPLVISLWFHGCSLTDQKNLETPACSDQTQVFLIKLQRKLMTKPVTSSPCKCLV